MMQIFQNSIGLQLANNQGGNGSDNNWSDYTPSQPFYEARFGLSFKMMGPFPLGVTNLWLTTLSDIPYYHVNTA